MHNETALLLRLQQRQTLLSHVILINPPDDPAAYADLSVAGVLHDSFAQFTRWESANCPVWFGCHLPSDVNITDVHNTNVILFLPKGKQRLLAQLTLLAGRIPIDSRVIVIGAVDAGIKSTGKKLLDYCHSVQKMDSARHCQAWSALWQTTSRIELSSLQQQWEFELVDRHLSITSLPGVFADGHLDTGSALLIKALEDNQSSQPSCLDVLDFGCGAGTLSVAVCALAPIANVTAVDIDAFALHATQQTANNNDCNISALPCATPLDIQGQFDLIISNPPFHRGVKQSTQITELFIQQLSRLLKPKGTVWLVANSFLDYETALLSAGLNPLVVTNNRAFKVIFCNQDNPKKKTFKNR